MEKVENEKVVEKPNSCEITIGAKTWTGKVKVYSESSDGAVDDAIVQSEKLLNYLELKNCIKDVGVK